MEYLKWARSAIKEDFPRERIAFAFKCILLGLIAGTLIGFRTYSVIHKVAQQSQSIDYIP